MHTGFQLPGRPSAGAWVNYALGTDNANLPAFVVMKSQYQSAAVGSTQATWSAGFLPSNHQGGRVPLGRSARAVCREPEGIDRAERRDQMDFIHRGRPGPVPDTHGDPEVLSKIAQYEMAYRMQESIPQVTDISDELDYILNMYGPHGARAGLVSRATAC